MSTPRQPHIDLGLELLANARATLANEGHPAASLPMSDREIALFITEITGQPVTGQAITNSGNRALAKLRRHSTRNRYRDLQSL